MPRGALHPSTYMEMVAVALGGRTKSRLRLCESGVAYVPGLRWVSELFTVEMARGLRETDADSNSDTDANELGHGRGRTWTRTRTRTCMDANEPGMIVYNHWKISLDSLDLTTGLTQNCLFSVLFSVGQPCSSR